MFVEFIESSRRGVAVPRDRCTAVGPHRTSMTRGSHSFRASHLQWILKLSSGVATAEETSSSLRDGSRHACTSTVAPIKINAFAAFLVTVPGCWFAASRQLPLSLQPFYPLLVFFRRASPRERWSPMSLHRSSLACVNGGERMCSSIEFHSTRSEDASRASSVLVPFNYLYSGR